MIYRMKFGDAYGDGYREYVQIWVSVLAETFIDAAIFSIKAQWGDDFFEGFAHDAGDAWLSDTVWEALYEADYPVDSIYQYCDVEDGLSADAHHNLLTFKNECTDTYLSIDCIVDMFIHLMNYHGAQIQRISAPFKTLYYNIGYGCFDF